MKASLRLTAAASLLLLCACSSGPGDTSSPTRLPKLPPAGEPEGFVGLTATKLQAAYGQPSFTRRENGSELWRYDVGNCRAFFFLYSQGRDMAVRHVETLPQGRSQAADPACLNALRVKPAYPSS